MNNNFKPRNLQETHQELIYLNQEVADEQIIYCHTEYDGHPNTVFQVEEHPETSCDVIEENIFAPENMEAANQDHSICFYCKEDLSGKRFYVHLFDHHGFTKQQCEVMKQHKRLENSRGKSRGKSLFSCTECGMEFITKSGLNSHLSKKNSPCVQQRLDEEDKGSAISQIVCPCYGCDSNFSTYLDLAVHVGGSHRDFFNPDSSFMIRRQIFPDKESFMKWKKQMETETDSEFFLRTSQKVKFAVRTVLYKCLCSNSRGQNKQKCEQCPAFIKACLRKHGQYEVVACFGHLGHEHPSETQKARDYRIAASEELATYQNRGRVANQLNEHRRSRRREHTSVKEEQQYENATQHSNGMMILMPGAAEEEEEFFGDVDDKDGLIPCVQKAPVSQGQVYLESSHHYPGPSHY